MDPKEACERFEMWLSSVNNATERSLPQIQQGLEAGKYDSATAGIGDIRESIDDMLSAFDRIQELAGLPRRYQAAY